MKEEQTPDLDDVGPWQDGSKVVATPESRMPRRCMVCGAEIGSLVTTRALIPRPQIRQGLVSRTTQLIAGERFAVHHGRCDGHRTPWSKIAGIACGVVCVASVIAFSFIPSRPRHFSMTQGVVAVLFAVTFAAMIGLFAVNLRVAKSDGFRVWLGGFGRGFRDHLPPLPRR